LSAKGSSKVAISDNDPQDANSIVERPVNRNIRRYFEDADVATEIRTPLPDPRLARVAAECRIDFVNDPIGSLGTFQLAANMVINSIYVGERILVDLDSLHKLGSTSVRDPIAGESLATSSLHIIGVEVCGWLASIAPFEGRLDLILQPIEISLMCAERFDAVLGR
jgi:hypothetical protein